MKFLNEKSRDSNILLNSASTILILRFQLVKRSLDDTTKVSKKHLLTLPPVVFFESPLQLVAGSVVMAFEEVCPERIDLIHKNYRKLCNLLIDVEEWGQVVIINMLTRYARTQFLNPNMNVSETQPVSLRA